MADESEKTIKIEEGEVESTDRGIFDFIKKKDEGEKKPDEHGEAIASEFEEKVQVSESEHKEEEKKHGLLEKLHRSDSRSSSSSDEEVEEGGEKKKKKKKKEKKEEDTSVPVEKIEESPEKKGFLDKIKEKLPGGGHKKTDEAAPVAEPSSPDGEGKEKKGFLDKLKEKIPGYHHSKTEEEKEKEKEIKD